MVPVPVACVDPTTRDVSLASASDAHRLSNGEATKTQEAALQLLARATELAGTDSPRWDFTNPEVEAFRRHAHAQEHLDLAVATPEGEYRLIPGELARSVLPAHMSRAVVTLAVRLKLSGKWHSLKVSSPVQARVAMVVAEIKRKLAERPNADMDVDRFVLRVRGTREFLEDERVLAEYECVRQAARREEEVLLTYLSRDLEDEGHQQHPAVLVRFASAGSDPSPEQGSPPSFPFRVRLCLVEGMHVPGIESVSIRAELWHGWEQLLGPDASFTTEMIPVAFGTATVWEWFCWKKLPWRCVPREALLVFRLTAAMVRTDEWGKTVRSHLPAGSLSAPVFDQLGRGPADGPLAYELWPPSVKPNHLLYRGPYRGTEWDMHKQARPPDPPLSASEPDLSADAPTGRTRRPALGGSNRTLSTIRTSSSVSERSPLQPLAPRLVLQFDSFPSRLQFQAVEERDERPSSAGPCDAQALAELLQADPLTMLAPRDREVLYEGRLEYTDMPENCWKLCQAVDYTSRQEVGEVYQCLESWQDLGFLDAFALLDGRFADIHVRRWAVGWLNGADDSDLSLIMIPLVQCLKFELYHRSALSSFLIRRAVQNRAQIGQRLFWLLRAELHDLRYVERFALILEEFLCLSPVFQLDLWAEIQVERILTNVARGIKGVDKASRLEILHMELSRLNVELPARFSTIFSSKIEATSLRVRKCKIFDSKKIPIRVVFQNSDPEGGDIVGIFKDGDDLRQDMVTLDLLKWMDKTFLDNGLDLRMTPYAVVSTGDNVGMIQAVPESVTLSSIQIEFGGKLLGAFSNATLLSFLEEHNPTTEGLERAKDNFARSCAGYCVATYVLGIGDRHNSNIMLRKDGCLFHIDFGHFLGNFKSKFGIRRERAPFVFTPEMAHVMGGRKSLRFKEFVEFCTAAYNILRMYGWHLIHFFTVMIAADMPELTSPADVEYLRQMLSLELSAEEASQKFCNEIINALETTSRRIDNFIHNVSH